MFISSNKIVVRLGIIPALAAFVFFSVFSGQGVALAFNTSNTGSCANRCGSGHDPANNCSCDEDCSAYADCCHDYHEKCESGSNNWREWISSGPQLAEIVAKFALLQAAADNQNYSEIYRLTNEFNGDRSYAYDKLLELDAALGLCGPRCDMPGLLKKVASDLHSELVVGSFEKIMEVVLGVSAGSVVGSVVSNVGIAVYGIYCTLCLGASAEAWGFFGQYLIAEFGYIAGLKAMQEMPCVKDVTPTSVSMGESGGSGIFNVFTTHNCNWQAKAESNWIQVDTGAKGKGNGTVTFSVKPNDYTESRKGGIEVSGRGITISQDAKTCSYSQRTDETVVGWQGGSKHYEVVTGDVCPWSTSATDWIEIRSNKDRIGRGYVWFEVGKNNGNERTGYIEVKGMKHKVVQRGICKYMVNGNNLSVDNQSGAYSFRLTTDSHCSWKASSNTYWITYLSPSSGSGSATIQFIVSENTGTSSRRGAITVGDQTVDVEQDGATAYNFTGNWAQTNNAIYISSIKFDSNGNVTRVVGSNGWVASNYSGKWTSDSRGRITGNLTSKFCRDTNPPSGCGTQKGSIIGEFRGINDWTVYWTWVNQDSNPGYGRTDKLIGSR